MSSGKLQATQHHVNYDSIPSLKSESHITIFNSSIQTTKWQSRNVCTPNQKVTSVACLELKTHMRAICSTTGILHCNSSHFPEPPSVDGMSIHRSNHDALKAILEAMPSPTLWSFFSEVPILSCALSKSHELEPWFWSTCCNHWISDPESYTKNLHANQPHKGSHVHLDPPILATLLPSCIVERALPELHCIQQTRRQLCLSWGNHRPPKLLELFLILAEAEDDKTLSTLRRRPSTRNVMFICANLFLLIFSSTFHRIFCVPVSCFWLVPARNILVDVCAQNEQIVWTCRFVHPVLLCHCLACWMARNTHHSCKSQHPSTFCHGIYNCHVCNHAQHLQKNVWSSWRANSKTIILEIKKTQRTLRISIQSASCFTLTICSSF